MLSLNEKIIYITNVENTDYYLTNMNNVFILKQTNPNSYSIVFLEGKTKECVIKLHELTNKIEGFS